jgi:hypothetical protein
MNVVLEWAPGLYVNFQSRPARLSRGCGRHQLDADRLQPGDERLLIARGNRVRSTLTDIQSPEDVV